MGGVESPGEAANGTYLPVARYPNLTFPNRQKWRMFPNKQKTNGVQREFEIQRRGSTIFLLRRLSNGEGLLNYDVFWSSLNQYARIAVSEKNGTKGTWYDAASKILLDGVELKSTCPRCKGTGGPEGGKCPVCANTGFTPAPKTKFHRGIVH